MTLSPLGQDIVATPQALREVLAQLDAETERVAAALIARGARRLIALGNGGSLQAAAISVYLHNALASPTGTLALASPTGDFAHYPLPLASSDALIGVSISGEIVDLLDLLESLQGRHQLVGVTNEAAATLNSLVEYPLCMGVAPNQVPMSSTKTFVASVAALDLLWLSVLAAQGIGAAAALRDELRRLPDVVERTLEGARGQIGAIAERLSECQRIFVVGAGPSYPLAQEAALVLKEIALLPAEGVQTRELAQGMTAVIDRSVGVIAVNPPGRAAEVGRRMLTHCADLGAVTVEVGTAENGLRLDASCHELLAPLVYAGPLFLLADRLGQLRGVDTAHPHWADDYLRLARRPTAAAQTTRGATHA